MAKNSLVVCLMFMVALSTVYEVQGTFLLRHYLRKIPRRSREFEPFACKGMLKFLDVLELQCPLKPVYKNFFGKLRSYMGFINSASGSENFNSELKGKAEGLHNAVSAMAGNGRSSVDTSKIMDVLFSMGKTLGEQRRTGSTEMSFEQRKDLIISMVKWARGIGQFVSSATSKSGNSIDLSNLLGLDGIDSEDSSSTKTGGSYTNTRTSKTRTGGSIDADSKTGAGETDTESPSSGGSGTRTGSSGSYSSSGGTSTRAGNTNSNDNSEEPTGSARSCKGNCKGNYESSGKYERSANYQKQSTKGSSEETSDGDS